jgi:predicted DNA-binding antitoxin AbrB/MazE fold protein
MMAEIVTAVYEKGLLRPLSPLKLNEHQTVRIQILEEKPVDEVDDIIQRLIADGLLPPPPGHSEIEPISDIERRELAETLGKAPGKPLSEIIIEEGGEI